MINGYTGDVTLDTSNVKLMSVFQSFKCKLAAMSWSGGVSSRGESLQERSRRLTPRAGETVDLLPQVSDELFHPWGFPLLLQHPAGCDRCHSHQWERCSDGNFLHTLQQVP